MREGLEKAEPEPGVAELDPQEVLAEILSERGKMGAEGAVDFENPTLQHLYMNLSDGQITAAQALKELREILDSRQER
jgi:hypothetical protein